jgi:hypothetical protein
MPTIAAIRFQVGGTHCRIVRHRFRIDSARPTIARSQLYGACSRLCVSRSRSQVRGSYVPRLQVPAAERAIPASRRQIPAIRRPAPVPGQPNPVSDLQVPVAETGDRGVDLRTTVGEIVDPVAEVANPVLNPLNPVLEFAGLAYWGAGQDRSGWRRLTGHVTCI